MLIPGKCHCGNIAIELEWPDGARIPARKCGCTFCVKHGGARCGVVPVVTSEIDGRTYAVVSVNALEGLDESRLDRAPADFEGEEAGARLHRRKRNWIADVNFRSTPTPTPRT